MLKKLQDHGNHFARRIRAFFARHWRRSPWRFTLAIVGWALLCGLALLSLIFVYIVQGLPSPAQIANPVVTQSTKIYDRTGTVLLYEISAGQNRTYANFDEIPQSLKDATLSIEDSNFYNEPAFDWRGILRAFITDVTHGQIAEGGSTITQQLARNAFLNLDQTFTRKLKELVVAIEIDREYTKDKTLELYLNDIPYGPTVYGVEEASEDYFGKPASDLDLAQSAVLAAIPQAPTYYSPWGNNVPALLQRQHLVLQRMEDTGRITQDQLNAALAEAIVFQPQNNEGIRAPHFVTAVEDYLTQKYGESALQTGGLKVITTLDWNLQQDAEQDVAAGVATNTQLYDGTNGSLVAEDPTTGQILALVGSANYFDSANDGQFDVATQGLRQPGSSLKPFIYLDAFMKGYTPDTTFFDVPTEFSTNPVCPLVPTQADFNNPNPKCFNPQDFETTFAGPISVRTALAQSVNIPAVEALYLDGAKSSIDLMNSFGLNTLQDSDPYGLSLALGGGAVHLMDLVGAYSGLAADGTLHAQSMVLEVQDKNGNALEQYQDQSKQVVDPEYARLVTNILDDVNARSGLFQGTSINETVVPGYQIALKTGTSNDYTDAWSLGYTPNLVVGVWAGNNDNQPMHRAGSSILAAVPMWHTFIAQALQEFPPETFPEPTPLPENKPIFAGQYTQNGQAHSILYYVDVADPTGAQPANPAENPQFDHWEAAAQAWAAGNPGAVAAEAAASGNANNTDGSAAGFDGVGNAGSSTIGSAPTGTENGQ